MTDSAGAVIYGEFKRGPECLPHSVSPKYNKVAFVGHMLLTVTTIVLLILSGMNVWQLPPASNFTILGVSLTILLSTALSGFLWNYRANQEEKMLWVSALKTRARLSIDMVSGRAPPVSAMKFIIQFNYKDRTQAQVAKRSTTGEWEQDVNSFIDSTFSDRVDFSSIASIASIDLVIMTKRPRSGFEICAATLSVSANTHHISTAACFSASVAERGTNDDFTGALKELGIQSGPQHIDDRGNFSI